MSNNIKNIFLNTSDIASFIGQNKWNYIESFERLWKKYDEDYIKCLTVLNDKVSNKNIELTLTLKEEDITKDNLKNKIITEDEYNRLSQKIVEKKSNIEDTILKITSNITDISLTQTQKIKINLGSDIINTISSDITETVDKRKITNAAINKLDINEKEKLELFKQTESLINKTHGTLKEDSAIQIFKNRFKVEIDTSQIYFKTLIKKTNRYDYYIGGKFDGINNQDKYLIEVKNRMKGFFNNVRDYELTQIQLYLFLSKFTNAKLVEKYNSKIKVTDIIINQEYINDTLEYLNIFIEKFEFFLLDYQMKLDYIQMDETNKQKFINKLYLNLINEKKQEKENLKNTNEQDCLIDDLDDF